ncbi:thiamine diphosphokinase [Atopobiaceae bacterium 24-176]
MDARLRVAVIAGSPEPCSPGLLASVCAASDYVVAADRGAAWCRDAGVVPDAFVGDGDSAGEKTLAWVAAHVPRREPLPCEKDMTDLSAAFALGESVAEARGLAPEFSLLCATGGRIDHALGVLGVVRRHSENPVHLFGDGWQAWTLSPAGEASVRVAGPDRTVSALPLADGTCISERGLHWPLDHRRLDTLDDLGVSNVVEAAGVGEVECHEGCCLVVAFD